MASSTPSSTLPPSSTLSAATFTSSAASDSSPLGISSNASLYIYTFLATLVLLLAVSSAIVIRSLILRRRHQRLVEEAIRAGTWVPHNFDPVTGRRRRDFGEKPRLFEAWVHSSDHDDGESYANEKSKWDSIMPMYAAYVNPPTSSAQGPLSDSADHPSNPSSRAPPFLRPFISRILPSSPQPNTVLPMVAPTRSLSPSSPASSPSPSVRVAVLIAMPSTSPKHHCDDDGPPVVEIGVVEVGVKDAENASPSRDAS